MPTPLEGEPVAPDSGQEPRPPVLPGQDPQVPTSGDGNVDPRTPTTSPDPAQPSTKPGPGR
jgi:hypothetical protein